jgi:glyoxylase-like metal-dependent hydrolase (beta-lactamase superfamily II)
MTTLASGLDYIDLRFLGHPGVIATAILHSARGVALIDPGPSTSLDHLREALRHRGFEIRDVRELLLTHIHLDHAGASGSLVRENPSIDVFVHERGAPHMANPDRLLQSAGRLYGQDMGPLWGEFLPVPAERLRPLKGGETITAGGRELQVAYTPGHATHHVSFFDRSSSVAFVGDTAGIRLRSRSDDSANFVETSPECQRRRVRRVGGAYVMPPMPPPDVDLEAWRESGTRILAWDPDTLFLTHFGPFHGARLQFQQLFDTIEDWSRIVRRLIADDSMDEAHRQQAFVDQASRDLRRAVGDAEAKYYGRAGRLDYSWQGLARYWRKR